MAMVTEDWSIEVVDGRLRFVLDGRLMGTGAVVSQTALALRSLADMADAILPPAPVQADLFCGVEPLGDMR